MRTVWSVVAATVGWGRLAPPSTRRQTSSSAEGTTSGTFQKWLLAWDRSDGISVGRTARYVVMTVRRPRLKCDGTRAETRFRLSVKTSPFNRSGGVSSVDYWHSRGVRISSSNAGYTMFRGSVKSTGYPLHSSVSPSLPLPCVTMFHHISFRLYTLEECEITGWSKSGATVRLIFNAN